MTPLNPLEVIPVILFAETGVKLIIGAPQIPGRAFDQTAFQEEQTTKDLVNSARPIIELISANLSHDPISLLKTLAPSFDSRATVANIFGTEKDAEKPTVTAIIIPSADPMQLTVAYDPVSSEYWIANTATLSKYIMQSRGAIPPMTYVPRDLVEAMSEMSENMPAWVAKAQDICGFDDAERTWFATQRFEGPGLSALLKTLRTIITSNDVTDHDEAEPSDQAYDVSYQLLPKTSLHPNGQCLIHANGVKGGQWIYKNVTTNVSDTIYYNHESGMKLLDCMRAEGLVVIEKNPT